MVFVFLKQKNKINKNRFLSFNIVPNDERNCPSANDRTSREIIDFNDLPVFSQVTTYPMIIRVGKSAPPEYP
jgi:hypothetical protein